MNSKSTSVSFSVRSLNRVATVALASLATCALAPSLQADLLILNAAGTASQVLRLDATTGAPVGVFRHETEAYYTMTLSPLNEICVASNTLGEHSLQVFGQEGHYLGDVARNSLTGLKGGMRGPDGAIYAIGQDDVGAGAGETYSILRIDTRSTTRLVPNGTGGMTAPATFGFGPDGHLYVGDANAGVLRFDGRSGVALGAFVPLGRGGLQDIAKMIFGPDGHLYVASRRSHAVLRFDGVSGAAIDTVVPSGSGGLVNPTGLAFGPDGHLYVTSGGTNQVLRFHGVTGASLGVFAAAKSVPGDPKVQWRDIVFEQPLPEGSARIEAAPRPATPQWTVAGMVRN